MKLLQTYKKRVDREIEIYLDKFIKETLQRDEFVAEVLDYIKRMTLAGGKRLRPALMHYGYLAAGGKDRKRIVKSSVSIELTHMFLLIHDDIIDHGVKRHGLDTVQVRYGNLGEIASLTKDKKHFGDSIAIIAGDLLWSLGNRILFESGFDPARIIEALKKMQSIVTLTVIGQSKDVYIEFCERASEKEVLRMYEYKTARYTFEGPLHLGAILSGGDKKLIDTLSRYAVPIGTAFQIQDDILGIFGVEEKIGKSVASDIEEGKQTLLVIKAMELANQKQRKILKNILGKKNLKADEIKRFQKIIVDTGALEYAKDMTNRMIKQGKIAIERSNVSPETKSFLVELADYMAQREI